MSRSSSALAVAGQTRGALPVLLFGAVMISFSGIFVRVSDLGPSATGFYRFLLALPALWLWNMVSGKKAAQDTGPRTATDFRDLTLAGLCLGLDLAVWHWAIRLSSVSNATLLGNTAPIWLSLAGWLFFGERFGGRFVLGLTLGICGVATLLGGSFSLSVEHVVGDLLGLLAGALWATYILAVGRVRERFTTAVIMAWTAPVCCLVFLPLALLSGESLVPPSLHAWLILLALALLCQVVGQSVVAWSLAHLPPAFASLTMLINPVSATFLAWLLLQEPLGPLQIAGGTVVLAGIMLARSGNRVGPRQAEAPLAAVSVEKVA